MSIVTVTLALLGYGVSLAAENLFGIPHAAMFDSAFELIDLASVAVLQIIPAIGQALSKWAFYVNLYRAQWPTVILAVAAVLLMAVVGWYWPDLRSNLVKAYAGKKTNDLNGARSAVQYWFMHALRMLFIFLSPLLALLGIVVIVLGLALLAMVPIMGMTAGEAYVKEWVLDPDHCALSSDWKNRQQGPHGKDKPGAVCVAVTKDGKNVARGRVVFSTSKAVVLFDPKSGRTQRVPISDAVVEVVDDLVGSVASEGKAESKGS